MNDLSFPGTSSTPAIACSQANGLVIMRGDSYPENSFELFNPVMDWIEHFLDTETRSLQFELHLLYLNTSSVKAMMDIFDLLESAHHKGRDVRVTWYYDSRNERVAELADEFREDCSFPFEIKVQDAPAA
jgi:hypothetical protein